MGKIHQPCPKCGRFNAVTEVECRIGPDYLKFEHKTCGHTFEIPRRELKTFEGLTYIEIWDRWLENQEKEDDSPRITREQLIAEMTKHLEEMSRILHLFSHLRKGG